MSNRSDLFDFVARLSEDAAGAALVTLGANPAPTALFDAPDENGAVRLLHVTNPSWAHSRFQLKEVADSLPPGTLARGTAQINIGLAQARYNVGLVMLPGLSAQECEQYDNPYTGMPDFRVKLSGPNNDPANIPGVTSTPPVTFHGFNLGTAQGLTDFLNWVPVSSTTTHPAVGPHA